jgi:uncharacterized protein (TIGR00369 family)
MDLTEIFNRIPLVELLGIEVTAVSGGHAEGRLEVTEKHASNPATGVVHGGVTYALADTVGGAAVVSLTEDVAPTIDMRIDYLAPATTDLRAVADVVRDGGNVAVVEVDVYDAEDVHVATAHGAYKTGGQSGDTPWDPGEAAPEVD